MKRLLNNENKPIVILDANEITQLLAMDILKPTGNRIYTTRTHAEKAIARGIRSRLGDKAEPDTHCAVMITHGQQQGWVIRHKETHLLSNGMSIQLSKGCFYTLQPDDFNPPHNQQRQLTFTSMSEALFYASNWDRERHTHEMADLFNQKQTHLALIEQEKKREAEALEHEVSVLGDTVSNLLERDIVSAKREVTRAKRLEDWEKLAASERKLRQLRQRVFDAEDSAKKALAEGKAFHFKFSQFVSLDKALQHGLSAKTETT